MRICLRITLCRHDPEARAIERLFDLQARGRGEQSFDLELGNVCLDTDSPILIKSTCNPVSHAYLQSFGWLLGAFSNFKNKIRLQKCVVKNTGQPI